MMKIHFGKAVLAAVALMFTGVSVFAQQNVTGTVKDAKGEPVIGAYVVVSGTTMGSMTDVDGNWALSVPANSTLVASCVGYTDASAKVVSGKKCL